MSEISLLSFNIITIYKTFSNLMLSAKYCDNIVNICCIKSIFMVLYCPFLLCGKEQPERSTEHLLSCSTVELGGMTKNVYHGIFLNYTGFTVYDGIFFFMHDRVLTTFSTD